MADTKGWVLVPVEPTEEMAKAGLESLQESLGHSAVIDRDPVFAYRAMLSASPALPAVDGGDYAELCADLRSLSKPSVLTPPDIHDYAADVIATQQQSIAALMAERTNLIETKREQIGRMAKEKGKLHDYANMRDMQLFDAVALLRRLQHWIEDEVGAEMPFVQSEADKFAALVPPLETALSHGERP